MELQILDIYGLTFGITLSVEIPSAITDLIVLAQTLKFQYNIFQLQSSQSVSICASGHFICPTILVIMVTTYFSDPSEAPF